MIRNLERLISCDQLISYPSEYRRFNQAYEDALGAINSSSQIDELYIVKYRSTLTADRREELFFSFVSEGLISDRGPYCLRDICAVLKSRTKRDLTELSTRDKKKLPR